LHSWANYKEENIKTSIYKAGQNQKFYHKAEMGEHPANLPRTQFKTSTKLEIDEIR